MLSRWHKNVTLWNLGMYPARLTKLRGHLDILLQNENGRDDWIRTSDLVVPNDARYQTAPHPVILRLDGGIYYAPIPVLGKVRYSFS